MEDSVYIQGARVVSDGAVFRADITIERGLITRVGSGFDLRHLRFRKSRQKLVAL